MKIKQIERKLQITYRWWRQDGEAIKKTHVEILEDHAIESIQRQMQRRNTSGELNDELGGMVRGGTPVQYRGCWAVMKS